MSKEKYLEELSNELQISKNILNKYIYIVGTNKENIKDYSLNSSCAIARKDNGFNISYTAKMLNDKDEKIADLEAKLAEAQKTIEIQKMSNDALIDENLDYRYDITDTAFEQAKKMAESWQDDYQQEIAELKQQLAEKEKEIEQWKSMAERSSSMLDRFNYCGESIIYNTTREQDKISFCIERLEKVKEYAIHIQGGLINYIDNQIASLKKEVK